MTERELTFDASSHSADAIQRAAYKLTDRLSLDLLAEQDSYRCVLHIQSDDADQIEATLADFRNEVLDETLRERIRAETADERNLILALAFSNTGLVDAADA